MDNHRKPREKTRFQEVPEKGEGERRQGAGSAGFRASLSLLPGLVCKSVRLPLTHSRPLPHSTQSHSPEKGRTRGRENRGSVTVPPQLAGSHLLPPGALPLPSSPPWLLHLLPWGLTQPPPGGGGPPDPPFKLGASSTLCRPGAFLRLFCSSVLDTKCLVDGCSPAEPLNPNPQPGSGTQ